MPGCFFGVTLGHNRNDFFRSRWKAAFALSRHRTGNRRRIDIQELRIGGAAAAGLEPDHRRHPGEKGQSDAAAGALRQSWPASAKAFILISVRN
jgi:hypothetical protein